jgi:hypothetical protein
MSVGNFQFCFRGDFPYCPSHGVNNEIIFIFLLITIHFIWFSAITSYFVYCTYLGDLHRAICVQHVILVLTVSSKCYFIINLIANIGFSILLGGC